MKKLTHLYKNLSDSDKKELLKKHYILENKSFADIADMYGTYSNKIRRDAVRLQIKIRDKSAAQKNALKTGKHKHPTKGVKRDDETKNKIGMGVLQSWEKLTDQELEKRKEKVRNAWQNMSENDKANLIKSANDAVRMTSKTGSKLEKFLLTTLLNQGFSVDFHKEQVLVNTKLQIDLFISSINTAIEIDGPSHFLPVWGEEALERAKTYDQKKQGLILGRGWVLIRIKQKKDFSKSRARLIADELINILKTIQNKFPSEDQRTFEIED
jgi:very-short-patch-repair endonuclease